MRGTKRISASAAELEPVTPSVGNSCSSPLSDTPTWLPGQDSNLRYLIQSQEACQAAREPRSKKHGRSLSPAAPAPALLLRARGSAPTTAHQVDIRARLKQGIGGRFDAIHPGNRIKDNVLLLAGIVRRHCREGQLAEGKL